MIKEENKPWILKDYLERYYLLTFYCVLKISIQNKSYFITFLNIDIINFKIFVSYFLNLTWLLMLNIKIVYFSLVSS